MMEAAKGIGRKYRKRATKDCFLFDSYFFSKKASEAVIEVVANLVVMVEKTKNIVQGYH